MRVFFQFFMTWFFFISILEAFPLSDISQFLPENPIILEAGANDGSDTISMANFFPKCTIYAFEPFDWAFEILTKKTSGFSNIHIFNTALGAFDGHTIFYQNDPNTNFFAQSSLYKPDITHKCFPKGAIEKVVSICKLDTWAKENNIRNIDFLWLDRRC